MRFVVALLVLMIALIAINPTHAAVVQVGAAETPAPVFVPDSVKIAAGDTVRWYQLDGDHTTTSGTGGSDPEAGNMYDAPVGFGFTFDFQFNTPGTYSNFCIPHELFGMKGKIVVTPTVAAHVSANGAVTSFFDPDSVPILTGQTVEFYWSTGTHTLTSGTGDSDPNAGDLIDSPLDFQVPAIQLSFGSPGTYPFFCRPHELEGMKTTVYVSDPCNCPCKYDPNCDGTIVDVLDVVAVVGRAFRGNPSTQDPGCPQERTALNAGPDTDVLDVVACVNVAFRGQSVATNFVDPCAALR